MICLGKIESVNGAMLKSLLEEESDLVVFMSREDNRSDGCACAVSTILGQMDV